MVGGFAGVGVSSDYSCIFPLICYRQNCCSVQIAGAGYRLTTGLMTVWDAETQALFAAVMSFWFGQRALDKSHSTSCKTP
ncbi:hypothetical protein [Bartonella sp. A05]|uniref:hypothetical protein n=1 Tax=Bartonella sp. A05 TaxID=2967261 RepID=UPI0022A9B1A4|nr:hypothetical protein [Bartonella sp. A05]MCZ2204430.1 hypothetical protein [Bartonella sp. A05]